MSGAYITIEDYIKNYEPHYGDEVEEQAAELGPWMDEKERLLELSPVFNEAKQRVYQKGLVAWAFSPAGPTCFASA
ncbi:MAG: hypothetical protein AB7V13_06350 [Pseudorhodoplanes sp.]|uniref:hypothetical protein n=1 Tax=Methylocystis sp. TaxID=1911079 RepID=UPI003D116A2C